MLLCLIISCTHVLGSVGSQDTGQQLGLAAFAIISADAQSAELGPGPGDIILHCENSFVSTPAYLHWAEQWAVAGIIRGLAMLDANSASCEASTQR